MNKLKLLVCLMIGAGYSLANNVLDALSDNSPTPSSKNIQQINSGVGAKSVPMQPQPVTSDNKVIIVNHPLPANNKPGPNPLIQKSNASVQSTINNTTTPPPKIAVSGLDAADASASSVAQMKREIEIQQLSKKLNSNQNPLQSDAKSGNFSQAPQNSLKNAVVTDVMINQTRNISIATLLFTDGTYSDVQQGSAIGEYNVSKVSLNGVLLTKYSKGHKSGSITLKRVYGRTLPAKTNNGINQNPSGSAFGGTINQPNGFSAPGGPVPSIITTN